MGAIEDNQELMRSLSSGGGISMPVDSVMRESARNLLIQQGNDSPTDEEVNTVYNLWVNGRGDITAYYQTKISELNCKYSAVINSLSNTTSEISSIASLASTGVAAPAAIPMYMSIRNEIESVRSNLMDCIKLCCEMNIAVPSPLANAVNSFSTCYGAVNGMPIGGSFDGGSNSGGNYGSMLNIPDGYEIFLVRKQQSADND